MLLENSLKLVPSDGMKLFQPGPPENQQTKTRFTNTEKCKMRKKTGFYSAPIFPFTN